MRNYIAVIHKDRRSDYGVSFPDFPGCVSAASSIDEAKDMAQEALCLHVKGMIEDGEAIPHPSRLDEIMADPDFSDAVAFVVISAPDSKPRAVRINVTVPEDTLRQIDAAARKRGMSRSSFLVHAAGDAMKPAIQGKPLKGQPASR